MEILRNEIGKYPDLAQLKSFDIIGLDSETHVLLAMALRHAIELYESKGWHEEKEGTSELASDYKKFKSLYAQMTDYKGHIKTFNGKRV